MISKHVFFKWHDICPNPGLPLSQADADRAVLLVRLRRSHASSRSENRRSACGYMRLYARLNPFPGILATRKGHSHFSRHIHSEMASLRWNGRSADLAQTLLISHTRTVFESSTAQPECDFASPTPQLKNDRLTIHSFRKNDYLFPVVHTHQLRLDCCVRAYGMT